MHMRFFYPFYCTVPVANFEMGSELAAEILVTPATTDNKDVAGES